MFESSESELDTDACVDVVANAVNTVRKESTTYYKRLAIINSSGCGKTRVCYNLAKQRKLVYLNWVDNKIGQPDIIKKVRKDLTSSNFDDKRDRFKYALKFVEAIVITANEYADAKSLQESQFSEKFRTYGGKFFDDLARNMEHILENATPDHITIICNVSAVYYRYDIHF